MASPLDRIKSGLVSLAARIDARPFKGAMDEIGFARAALIGYYPDKEKNPDDLKIDDYLKMLENDGQAAGVARDSCEPKPLESTAVTQSSSSFSSDRPRKLGLDVQRE